MSHFNLQGAMNQYRQVDVRAGIDEATSPHRLIGMLLDGALEKINTARGHMARGETAAKGRHISWAISIIEGLRASLDPVGGGEIAANLEALYDYMSRQLLHANLRNDGATLEDVARLLGEIRQAWEAIPQELRVPPPATGDGRR